MKSNFKIMRQYLTSLLPLLLLATLTGCPGGGDITAYSNNTDASGIFSDGIDLMATQVTNTAPASECAYGGVTVNAGLDINENKSLDSAEVMSTQYICNDTVVGDNEPDKLFQGDDEGAGSNCSNGGNKVSVGKDADSDGMLNDGEITSTRFMCGGSNGHHGNSGHRHFVIIKKIKPGRICTFGGNLIISGVAHGFNRKMNNDEIISSKYACNGKPGIGVGSEGTVLDVGNTDCPAGGMHWIVFRDYNNDGSRQCASSSLTGSYPPPICEPLVFEQNICNGVNGFSSLVFTEQIPLDDQQGQSTCPNGGIKITSGLDDGVPGGTANDGILQAEEVNPAATTYVCDGAPGPGVSWEVVSVLDKNAEPNKGYIVNYTGQVALLAASGGGRVTITLPASGVSPTTALVEGDVVQVTGVSAGGWKVQPNPAVTTGQTIITTDMYGSIGSSWIERDATVAPTPSAPPPEHLWAAVASSADGSKLIAAEHNSVGLLYTSTDSGVTWTSRMTASSFNWSAVASSADGNKLVAVTNSASVNGHCYTSTNSGISWTEHNLDNNGFVAANLKAVASSADGRVLVAAAGSGGKLYTSINSGASWTESAEAGDWSAVASSADGTKLVAAQSGALGTFYTTSDNGVHWSALSASAPTGNWSALASSADGTKLVAVTNGASIFTSTNSGADWAEHAVVGSPVFSAVASSADGSKLVAVANVGIYTSINSGYDWTEHVVNGLTGWIGVASSADGSKLLAAVNNGQLYTSGPTAFASTKGAILGGQYDAVDLQYLGNDTFIVRGFKGYLEVQ